MDYFGYVPVRIRPSHAGMSMTVLTARAEGMRIAWFCRCIAEWELRHEFGAQFQKDCARVESTVDRWDMNASRVYQLSTAACPGGWWAGAREVLFRLGESSACMLTWAQ